MSEPWGATEARPDGLGQVEQRARALYQEVVGPLCARFSFEGAPPQSETRGLPVVLFLGNHSSGKSSFINHLIGVDVQRTGVAPIDDGFTILTHGPEESVKDGEAVVTHPDLAWGDLLKFGPQLVSHLRMRQRPSPALQGLALVDSPGMIDAANATVTRGYDFAGVVRWFAERADVILFLFDPDKPGTTGETLSVLTQALAGLDHKLLLIFNKVDLFSTMRDFARAYGALCWNLSKAIPRKDLPHIFTTYLPVPDARKNPEFPLADFDRQREEVREEVRRAPYRRADNVISRLYQHARRLRVHCLVLDRLRRERLGLALRYAGLGALVVLLGGLFVYAGWTLGAEASRATLAAAGVAATLVGLGVVAGLYAWDRHARRRDLSLDALFERTFLRELTLGDDADDLRALWASVQSRVKRALELEGRLPRLGRGELRRLERAIATDVPDLRKLTTRGS